MPRATAIRRSWSTATPALSCPRCCNAMSPSSVVRATSVPSAQMPKTPHATQRLVGHLCGVAVDLLVEHGILPPTRPDAPRVVVDYIGNEQVAVGVSPKLDLEIDELHILLRPGSLQRLEDAPADLGEAVDLISRCHAVGHDPIRVDERVVIGVILEEELDHSRVESRAFRDVIALQVRAGGDATHHHHERDHVAAADDHLVRGRGIDEMSRDTGGAKKPENVARGPTT